MTPRDPPLPYADRADAGRHLAAALAAWRGRPGLLVLALPRGGVPVAFEVARALEAPLDVFLVRKLGHPSHPEYAVGAIASGGVQVLNPGARGVAPEQLEQVVAAERAELLRRERLYRGDAPPADLAGRNVVVVDDGLATGATMRAAAEAIRRQHPAALCLAAPVGAAESLVPLRELADEVVCPARPEHFRAVSLWYRDFPQTGDDEVHALLARARGALAMESR